MLYWRRRSPDDSPEIQECFFIHLISTEQLGVVAKIAKKPIEFPERAFGTVKASREGKCLKGGRFQYGEAQRQEGFLGMPAIGKAFAREANVGIISRSSSSSGPVAAASGKGGTIRLRPRSVGK